MVAHPGGGGEGLGAPDHQSKKFLVIEQLHVSALKLKLLPHVLYIVKVYYKIICTVVRKGGND